MEVHTYTLEKEHQQEHDEYKRLDETKKKIWNDHEREKNY
jgi:hypothetical protein